MDAPVDPVVSLIVATTGSSEQLREVLRLAREQVDAVGGELILAWNADPAGPAAAPPPELREIAHAVVLEPLPGKSRALNAGVQRARADLCAFLDDDGLPKPGWLAALIEPLLQLGSGVGGVGGRVKSLAGEDAPAWYQRLVRHRSHGFLGPMHDLGEEQLEYGRDGRNVLPLGANCAYRREILLRFPYSPNLGPNWETGARGGEDTLLALQVLDAGLRLVYAPKAEVYHPVRPERMTPEFVLHAYHQQGVEMVRIQRALGQRQSSAWKLRLCLRLVKDAPLMFVRRFLPPAWLLRVACRQARRKGMLRELLGWAPAAIACAALPFFCSGCGESDVRAAGDRPNVVFCVIDTLRADHLGCYGYPVATSPNLDRFAAECVRFEHAYSQAPRTLASHASMFTSTYPAVHGAWNQAGPLDESQEYPSLSPKAICLAEVLQAVGYRTAAFADGGWLQADRGLAQGFDSWDSQFRGAKNRVDSALDWLDSRKARQPFFLFLHTYEVHTPYLPPADLLEGLAPDYHGKLRETLRQARELMASGTLKNPIIDVHRRLFEPLLPTLTEDDRKFLVALYDAEIRSADREIGRFLDGLRSRGLLENTIVILAADHGEEFGEHGGYEHTQVYEECLHVPFLWRLPGGSVVQVRSDPVELVDLMPTLLTELDIRVPAEAQGRILDLRASGDPNAVREMWAETNEPTPQIAWRRGALKVMLFPCEGPQARVFDLQQDPGENSGQPQESAPQGLLQDVRMRRGVYTDLSAERRRRFELQPVPRSRKTFDQNQLKELRALGYL